MAKLEVIYVPDSRLKEKSKPVERITDDTRQLLEDMLEVMYQDKGIGLAANQVGITKRLIVIDLNYEAGQDPQPLKMINPEITEFSEEKVLGKEGCLSCPGIEAEIERSLWIRFKYLDEMGRDKEQYADGLFAICVQHEIDHLNGITLLDHIPSPLKREKALKKIIKCVTLPLKQESS